ncbi:MAG: cation:proton antiporter [Desulfuromonadales bacterium]|uniref:cation:proton antiporter domain-containing protein n=1 Tax=Desulfuromonas sp. KJ2020 TaxID=2919173 RepID=UPI000324C8F1|nr:cation:proton antiporter [Desulfuromonas sp. KJ2020]MCP3176125.1 cation:proton antiporter [Desulfuromonas sp. KJ2020]
MEVLSHHEITALFLALGLLLATARLLGETARRFNLPSVLGEILAGILWGPTIFGVLAPAAHLFLFPRTGGGAVAFDALTTLAIVLFLLVAGMEVNLSTVWRQGKVALWVALAGMLLPFALGFAVAWWLPGLVGYQPGVHRLAFALFMATALSISALPIIAKILMDLNIYRSDLGVTVVAAAVFNDLLGWLVFAVILGMLGASSGMPLAHTLWLTLVFTAAMLTVVPWVIHRLLPWVQAHASWPGGVLGFALSFGLLAAAFTEWIGIHAIFGSFLAGVALGHSSHLRERTRTTIDQFVSFIFAPLFFASIGLKVNFAANFDLLLTMTVLSLALSGKVIGSALGGRLGGLSKRDSLAVGFGMSAQGTMGIILGVLALQYGLISEQVFVSLVVMALITSLVSGPMLQGILRLKKPRHFTDFLISRTFLCPLSCHTHAEAIASLAQAAAEAYDLDSEAICEAVMARERLMPTGIGNGLAVPHARLPDLKVPVVAVGLPAVGIDFDAPDDTAANIIFLILTPTVDNGAQLEILSDIATTFKSREVREKAGGVTGFTEFLALVRSSQGH